ncbi:restriction endonuclease [Aureisphaera galaxeae]|uniref:restriction endonuclease n=1 Tax=Aureisphaera galaxeae TaxID=1538023 RepID=UPI002350C036|nr:restriction endonuclease [Aureisphaera galaxeae]MDC8005001.1 restriction endonuclease [Aureisphaera galaxeae]
MPGKPKDKLQYLEGINELDFPFLIGDILTQHFNHRNVKIVDGTGDGKRDVFSINLRGEEVVTQCKFHYDFNKTSGTRETDEIVIALNKFKCSNGFFCTSGKLSPQSKREYLDNYPDFDLKWLEGHEIVDIVLETPILRKIWFKGEKIHLLKNSVSIPFIVRKLPQDVSFPLEKLPELNLDEGTEIRINEKSLYTPNQFRPFNSLDIRNSGSHFGSVFAFEAVLNGNVYLNSIDRLKTEVLKVLVSQISQTLESEYIAVRFGIPYFTDNKDLYRRYKIEKFSLPINSETFILRNSEIIKEYDFLIGLSNHWERPERIHMSQLNDFCFYNKENDLALYIYYSCVAQEDLHPHVTRQMEVDKIIWKKSLFLTGDVGIQQYFEDYPPNKVYSFGPNAELACWMHPRPMMYSADISEFEKSLFHEEFEGEKKKLLEYAESLSLDCVDWEKASKIAALNDEDPFPNDPETSYRIVDILEEFHTIPSPIKPDKREFIFECVWKISSHDDKSFESRINKFSDRMDDMKITEKLNFTIDNGVSGLIYLRVAYTPEFIVHLSTSENLDNLTVEVKEVFNEVEQCLSESFSETKRATNFYWLAELGVFLSRIEKD